MRDDLRFCHHWFYYSSLRWIVRAAMLKSSFSPHCMQCKDGCQEVAEGVVMVSMQKLACVKGYAGGPSGGNKVVG